jgi:hypothetical protein
VRGAVLWRRVDWGARALAALVQRRGAPAAGAGAGAPTLEKQEEMDDDGGGDNGGQSGGSGRKSKKAKLLSAGEAPVRSAYVRLGLAMLRCGHVSDAALATPCLLAGGYAHGRWICPWPVDMPIPCHHAYIVNVYLGLP